MSDEEDEVVLGAQQFNSHVGYDQQTVIIEGMLKKKSPKGIIKAWQDRWSRLTNLGLTYYKTREATEEKGFIPLYAIQSVTCDSAAFKKKGFRFDIVLSEKFGGRVFSFIAKTENECLEWVGKLYKVIEDHKNNASELTTVHTEEDPTGGKIWKTKKNTSAANVRRAAESSSGSYLLPYRLMSLPNRPSTLDSPQIVCNTLFGDFKIENREAENEFGATFIVGDGHYSVTHRSYLLHAIENVSVYSKQGIDAMNQLSQYDHPVMCKAIHTGKTSDTVFTVFHPPLRANIDSIYQWLEIHQRFPEDVIKYISSILINTLDYIHEKNHLFVLLSPETIFFDAEGNVRIFDTLLPVDANTISICNDAIVPEYTPPEIVIHGRGKCSVKADSWRLGALLYEMVTSIPLFRPRTNCNDTANNPNNNTNPDEVWRNDIMEQIKQYNNSNVAFPPTCNISPELQDLIRKLLDVNALNRPSCMTDFKQHSFFKSINNWDIQTLLQNKPKWVQEKICGKLSIDELTPSNLTLKTESIMIRRVGVSVLNIVGLPFHLSEKLYCNIIVEGDVRRTKVLGPDSLEWNEDFYFDLLNGSLPEYSDVIIELHSKKKELEMKSSQIGLVTIPLNDIRRLGHSDVYLSILGVDNIPIGDIHVNLGWIDDPVNLENILQPLSDESMTFSGMFGKNIPAPPNMLWSLIADPIIVNTSHSHIAEAIAEQVAVNYNTVKPLGSPGQQFFTVRHERPTSSPSMNSLFSPLQTPTSPISTPSNSTKMTATTPANNGKPPGPPPLPTPTRTMPPRTGSVATNTGTTPAIAPRPSLGAHPSFTSTPSPYGLQSPHIQPLQATPSLQQQSSLSSNGPISPSPMSIQPPIVQSPSMHPSSPPLDAIKKLPPPTPTAQPHPRQVNNNVNNNHHTEQGLQPSINTSPSPYNATQPQTPLAKPLQPPQTPTAKQMQPPPLPGTTLPPPLPTQQPSYVQLPKPAPASPAPPVVPAPNPSNDPENWRIAVEKSTGNKYYYNKCTKETRWDPPPCGIKQM